MEKPQLVTMLSAATTVSNSEAFKLWGSNRVFQASGTTSSGSGSATVLIQVSLDNSNWVTLGTISLTLGTTATSDGFASDAPWIYTRARVSAISGTGASVNVNGAIVRHS